MNEHPIQGMVEAIMESLTQMTDVTTIVGDPIITPGGVTIIPISKVMVGFGMGGGNFKGKQQGAEDSSKSPFGGGGTGAVSITPVAFLTVSGENVKLITIDRNESSADKALAMAPEVIDKVIAAFKKDEKKRATDTAPDYVITVTAEEDDAPADTL